MGLTFQAGNVAALLETGITNPLERFAVTADGKRVLVPTPAEETESARPVTVAQNWLAGNRGEAGPDHPPSPRQSTLMLLYHFS